MTRTEKILANVIPAPIYAKLRVVLGAINSNSSDGKSARAAISVFAIRVSGAVLAFVLQVFLARWIGVQQYGIFILVWVGAVLLGELSCIGLQTAVVRFITEYRTKFDAAGLKGILLAAPLISIAVACLIATLGLLGLQVFSGSVPDAYFIPFVLALICLPILAIEDVQAGIARSFDMPVTALGPVYIIRPLSILIVLYVVGISGITLDAISTMGAAIIATLMSAIIQAAFLWRGLIKIVRAEFENADQNNGGNRKPVIPKFQTVEWMKMALPVFLAGGVYSLLANIDVLLIGYFLSPQHVAIYFAAIKTLALVHFVQFALRAASAHHFSRYFTNNDMGGLEHYARKIAQWSFWPTIILAGILVLAGKSILAFFGAQFVVGYSVLFILATGIVARSSLGPAESLLSMCKQQNILVVILTATLACNVGLNIFLIPAYGITGAAIATSVAMLFESIALYLAIYHRMGIHLFAIGRSSKTRGQVA